MRKTLAIICALVVAMSAMAQSADSVRLVNAYKHRIKLRGADAYTIRTTLFDAPQCITVIRFSQEKFRLFPHQPSELTPTSVQSKEQRALVSINACYWDVKVDKPETYVKCGGEVLWHTLKQTTPRVNGLFKIYDNHAEVVLSNNYPDYKGEVEDCNDVIASGPVLIDDGKPYYYEQGYVEKAQASPGKRIPFYTFFTNRHPRSVVGTNKQGDIIFLVVDGRHQGWAGGATIDEMTKICSWLGMHEALNLDGGGSSTIWSKKYGVMNYPSDNRTYDHNGERKVSSTLLVKRR